MARLAADYPGYPQYPSDRDGFQSWLEAERAFWAHLDAAEDALTDGQFWTSEDLIKSLSKWLTDEPSPNRVPQTRPASRTTE